MMVISLKFWDEDREEQLRQCVCKTQNEAEGQNYTWKSTSFLLEGWHDAVVQSMCSGVYFSIGYETLGKLLNLSASFSSSVKWAY